MLGPLVPKAIAERPTAFDLFSGAGGTSLGLEAAGFRTVGAVDIDPKAGDTFRLNFPDVPESLCLFGADAGDITKIDPKTLKQRLALESVHDLDLLVATPPCQGFSRIGRAKLNSLAERAGAFIDDPRNKLYRRAIEILCELRPKIFMFENVAGILHINGQNFAEVIAHEVESAGYQVRYALLNTAWYGVPQTRERVVLLGFRIDLNVIPEMPAITHTVELKRGSLSGAVFENSRWVSDTYFAMPCQSNQSTEGLAEAVTAWQALSDLPVFDDHYEAWKSGAPYKAIRNLWNSKPKPYRSHPFTQYQELMRKWESNEATSVVYDHFCRWTPRDFRIFKAMPNGACYPEAIQVAKSLFSDHHLTCKNEDCGQHDSSHWIPPYPDDKFSEKWRKLDKDKPSWTVTAHLSKDAYSHIHYDSAQARTITLREAARIQSFPDAFIFAGNTGDVFRQIGNAVPPLLAKALGQALLKSLDATKAAARRPAAMGATTV